MAATFFGCLALNLVYGLLIGVTLNLLIVLHRNARPKISCEMFEVSKEKVLVISPLQSLYFPSADAILKKITKCASSQTSKATIIVINGHLISRIDASVADSFASFYRIVKRSNKRFVFWNWENQPKTIIIHSEPHFEFMFHESENLETLLQQMDIVVPIDLTTRLFYQR